jgi:hypothetical protein
MSNTFCLSNFPDEVICEILRHLSHTQTRLINKKLTILSDKAEMVYGTATPFSHTYLTNKNRIYEFLKTNPTMFCCALSGKFDSLGYFIYRSDGRYSVVERNYCYYMSVDQILKESDKIIFGPLFLLFVLSQHPLGGNSNYKKKKLITTLHHLFEIFSLKTYASLYLRSCWWDLKLTSRGPDGMSTQEYEKSHEVLLEKLEGLNNINYKECLEAIVLASFPSLSNSGSVLCSHL